MKFLFDFFPLLFFFGTFRLASAHKDWASKFANEHLAGLVSGGVIGADDAPVLLATVVVIIATVIQIGWLMLRRKKIDLMLWVNFGIVAVLGTATVWFHDQTFIKWKPTMIYGMTALTFLLSDLVFGKNVLRAAMNDEIRMPDPAWRRLNFEWVAFFASMACLNLYVAFHYPTDTWVNFKTFGGIGLVFLNVLFTGLYINRHMIHPAPQEAKP